LILVLAYFIRSGQSKPDFGCPFVSLIEMNVETFPANRLPRDLAKIPARRQTWQQMTAEL
jgi:orotate phosphoribosyltransferase